MLRLVLPALDLQRAHSTCLSRLRSPQARGLRNPTSARTSTLARHLASENAVLSHEGCMPYHVTAV